MSYSTAWERQGVVKWFRGQLTGPELAASVEEVASDPRFDQLRFIINDFRGIDGHSIDNASLERIAVAQLGSMASNPNIRVALVTMDSSLVELADVNQQGTLFKGAFETKAFPTLKQAREWLESQPTSNKQSWHLRSSASTGVSERHER